MNANEIRHIETDLLLEGIFRRYGYDFRSYARASIQRRITQFMSATHCTRVSEMLDKVLHDEEYFSKMAQYFSVPVTEMFRDPEFFRAFRKDIVPVLRTWPSIKVWHAGCATGEEAYSLAIILKEEDLYQRSTIYATDFNDAVLHKAQEGIYEIKKVQDATRNYQQAGGMSSFSEYYSVRYNAAAMKSSLRDRITFANHNLATDGVFGDMHVVFCRNALIYFNRELQNRALRLFRDSLVNGGFLCLGAREDLRFSDIYEDFEPVHETYRMYKKKAI